MRAHMTVGFNFTYTKKASEIIEKMKSKINAVRAKVEERQTRIVNLRKEHDIDDGALVQLLTQARRNQDALKYTYQSTPLGNGIVMRVDAPTEIRTVGAGVVQNLLTESDFIATEKEEVESMELTVRNLRPISRYASGNGALLPEQEFELNAEQLKYLGF